MSDILIECKKDRLQSMLKILQDHQPQQIQQYNLIYNYLYHYEKINRNRDCLKSDRWNIRFYTHFKGDSENCTLITISEKRDYYIFCFTLQESRKELKECLQKTNLINWHNKDFNMFSHENIFKTLNDVACEKLPIKWNYPPLENIMYSSKENIAELPLNETLPDDLYVAPLDPLKHAKIIDDYWYYKGENSLCLIRESIELNGGLGLFRRGQEQPICWIATSELFTPGFLYTLKSERGHGYGLLMSKLELKRLIKLHNMDLFSFVSVENTASLSLHHKLGFRTLGRLASITKPIGELTEPIATLYRSKL